MMNLQSLIDQNVFIRHEHHFYKLGFFPYGREMWVPEEPEKLSMTGVPLVLLL